MHHIHTICFFVTKMILLAYDHIKKTIHTIQSMHSHARDIEKPRSGECFHSSFRYYLMFDGKEVFMASSILRVGEKEGLNI